MVSLLQHTWCRGTSSEVQGSATDGDPCPRLKKRLDQTRQPEGLTESRKMTDAEKRRIRRLTDLSVCIATPGLQ